MVMSLSKLKELVMVMSDYFAIPWRRKGQPTSAFFPGKSLGQRGLVGYSPWGHKELDMTGSEQQQQWTIACPAPLFLGFPRQESWSGLPFLSPGNPSHPGIKSVSPALAGRFLTTEPPGKPSESLLYNGIKGWKLSYLLPTLCIVYFSQGSAN